MEALNLLLIPFHFCLSGDGRARANLARGQVKRLPATGMAKLLEKLRQSKFNKAEIIYDIKTIKLQSQVLKVELLKGLLTASPTSELWLPSDRFVVGDRASSFRQVHALGQERTASHFKLRGWPVSFEIVLTLAAAHNMEGVLDKVAERLAGMMQESFTGLELFGCCDAGNEGFQIDLLSSGGVNLVERREMMFLKLDRYPELGKRFRTLHPIMFGPAKVCLGIASSLKGNSRVIENRDKTDFAVIRLSPSSVLKDLEYRAKRWLIQ